MLNYYFCVPASDLQNGTQIYLRGLSEKGSINLSLLGSGEIELIGWRFFNDDNGVTTLTYNFNAYPEYKKKFTNLKLIFTNVSLSSNVITLTESDGLVINNGKNTISFDWREKGFLERSLYKVEMNYDIVDTDTGTSTPASQQPIDISEWFLTTQLFNNCYKPSHEDYMRDFNSDKYQSIRDKYRTVKFEFKIEEIINNSPSVQTTVTGGSLVVPDSQYNSVNDRITIRYTHVQAIDISIRTSLNKVFKVLNF